MERYYIINLDYQREHGMQVASIGNHNCSMKSVFSDFQQSGTSYIFVPKKEQGLKTDTFELSQKVTKQPLITKKKVIGAVIIAAAAAAVIAAAVSSGKNMKKAAEIMKLDEEHAKQSMNELHNALFENPVKHDFRGIGDGACFYGPDSKTKEQAIEGLISELGNAGYEIKRTPRANEATNQEISHTLAGFFDDAISLFKDKNKRTAIIIRDLDKLSPDDYNSHPVTGVLKKYMDDIAKDKDAYAVIGEAVDMKNVDGAVRRRLNWKIPAIPAPKDSLNAQKLYAEQLAQRCAK